MEEMLAQLVANAVAVTAKSQPVMAEVQCDLAKMQARFQALEIMGSPGAVICGFIGGHMLFHLPARELR